MGPFRADLSRLPGLAHSFLEDSLEVLLGESGVSSLRDPSLRILPKLESDIHSSLFSQVVHLLTCNQMHILNKLESCQHFEGEVFERIF